MWFQNVSKEKIIKSAVLHSWLIAIATEISKTVKPFFDMALSACTIDKDEMIHYQRSKHWREDLHTTCLSIACQLLVLLSAVVFTLLSQVTGNVICNCTYLLTVYLS